MVIRCLCVWLKKCWGLSILFVLFIYPYMMICLFRTAGSISEVCVVCTYFGDWKGGAKMRILGFGISLLFILVINTIFLFVLSRNCIVFPSQLLCVISSDITLYLGTYSCLSFYAVLVLLLQFPLYTHIFMMSFRPFSQVRIGLYY